LARLRVTRRQLQQLAAGTVGQHIDSTVLKDAHVADPLVEIRQQRFLVDDLIVVVQLQTENRLAGQATLSFAKTVPALFWVGDCSRLERWSGR